MYIISISQEPLDFLKKILHISAGTHYFLRLHKAWLEAGDGSLNLCYATCLHPLAISFCISKMGVTTPP